MSSEDSECSDLGSGLGSNLGSDLGSDELMDVDSLEVPCVLCPTSPLPAYDASLHGSVVVRRIQVDELIYGGRHRCSEVYAGRILQAEGLSSDDGPEPSVVVKLVDPSRFKFDDDGDACYYWTSEAAAQRVCTVEVASYAALVGVPVVPKWFGSYCFVEKGRRMFGHVLERIEGETFEWKSDVKWNGATQAWCQSVLEALDLIHQRKVYHRDIGPTNVIFPLRLSPKRALVIFVDFDRAIVDDPADLDDRPTQNHSGSVPYDASRLDYACLASVLVEHAGTTDHEWGDWLRSIMPRTPVVHRAMEAWCIED